jgi:murein DD-endopeptidase MepM/ murein hydrolase activator NlpD
MNFRISVFCLFLAATLLAASFPQGLYGEEGVYTVRRGDTCYSIARALGVSADELMKLNGITDPSRLLEGQRLKIPVRPGQAPSSPAAGSGGFITYRVVRGDTFYSLSRKFSVTEAVIREANSLSQTYGLREGDTLRIPQAGGTTPAPRAAEVPQPAPRVAETVNSQASWPINARELSYMTGKLSGVVITGTRTESVKSLTRGTVLSAGPYRGWGRVAIIQVEGGYLYVYGGCESLSIREGDRVYPGTELGKLGVDPQVNKPQLFFMVFRNNLPVDPARAPRA